MSSQCSWPWNWPCIFPRRRCYLITDASPSSSSPGRPPAQHPHAWTRAQPRPTPLPPLPPDEPALPNTLASRRDVACVPEHTAHHRGIAENILALSRAQDVGSDRVFSHMPETGLVRTLDSRHVDPDVMASPRRCLSQTPPRHSRHGDLGVQMLLDMLKSLALTHRNVNLGYFRFWGVETALRNTLPPPWPGPRPRRLRP